MRQKYIGIIGKHLGKPKNHWTSALIRDEIINALNYFGALPIGIPLSIDSDDSQIPNYLELCDGFIFPGGNHISQYEYEFAKNVHQHNKPAMGFCSGQTTMVCGATPNNVTVVDVNPEVHKQPDKNYAHEATVIPDTQFGRIVQTDQLMVNSRHRTCIVEPPAESTFCVSAFGPEGYAEVIEDPTRKFYLSTRFHPESNFRDKFMSRIFEAFIANC